ncbi:hypothetical protein HELRODRAFT_169112 [Helobdella robusta]|uniref:Uncharacterized protein n=1 Tax=Helobdella robusta TaxID=6412 RepID=T1F1E8_HELRO|nr:hypothetical protein HELRODRAFT_169112 [Helobdella robusta]ESO08306.1 hypothetical protein HELRODRAFT_169112 [Helobdella robusta]
MSCNELACQMDYKYGSSCDRLRRECRYERIQFERELEPPDSEISRTFEKCQYIKTCRIPNAKARKKHRVSYNITADKLYRRGDALVVKSLDVWGINNLVAEKTLYLLRCKLLIERDEHYLKNDEKEREREDKKIDEERVVFVEFCEWFELEIRHGITTVGQVQTKLQEFDQSPDKKKYSMFTYSMYKLWLKIKLREKYQDTLYFTRQGKKTNVLCLCDCIDNILQEHQTNLEHGDKKIRS